MTRILCVFTQVDGLNKDPKKEVLEKNIQLMNYAKKSIVSIMKNWMGVIYLSSSPLGLYSLIASLNSPIRYSSSVTV